MGIMIIVDIMINFIVVFEDLIFCNGVIDKLMIVVN